MRGSQLPPRKRSDQIKGGQGMPTEKAPFDGQELLTRCMGNRQFAERVLDKFLTRLEADVSELEQAIAEEDLTAVARVAHRIKGASANVAAHRLHECCAGLEQRALRQNVQHLAAELDALRAEQSRFAQCARLAGNG